MVKKQKPKQHVPPAPMFNEPEITLGNPLQPTPALLAKLGSIIEHLDEGTSADGHHFDWQVIYNLTRDDEVVRWMAAMRKLAMLPVKRRAR